MSMEIALLKFVHILAFVYWLGADLGVWYTGFYAANRKLSAETRVTVIRILFALDMAPRICMTLMLAIGIHLSYRIGYLPVAPWVIYASYVVCLSWMGMLLYLHYGKKSQFQLALTQFDFGFRLALIAGLSTYAAVSLSGQSGASADFIAWKLLIFATMIACGLMVRIKLKPLGPAFAKLVAGNPSQADEDAIDHSIAATRPWMLVIWAGLLLSAALGLHLVG
ncbi:MAG: hypothetical protein SH820_10750 [Xanthomonadales bacterium]|nr:hypothetical protein [Xanthomonadales bacterium]